MKNFPRILLLLALVSVISAGCLTVEKKEYSFKFTGKNSGTLTIKYVNLLSDMDDSTDVSAEDFQSLLDDYLYGTEIEKDYPTATNVKKKIFEENGVLCGEVTMEFSDLAAARLFKYDKKSPYMYSLANAPDSEDYIESNGKHGGDNMNVVFWDKKAKELTLTTRVAEPDEGHISLIREYRKWKK